ncbi:MAG: hypothetical protein MPL62_06395 [Alphaproteobacteria bacterium]|nr:hypothetical protein [Alphaproteobacteria bacterium]
MTLPRFPSFWTPRGTIFGISGREFQTLKASAQANRTHCRLRAPPAKN